MQVSEAFQWYTTHGEELAKYAGKHVAIVNDVVAGIGNTAEKAYKMAKEKYPEEEPALAFIPKTDILIL